MNNELWCTKKNIPKIWIFDIKKKNNVYYESRVKFSAKIALIVNGIRKEMAGKTHM